MGLTESSGSTDRRREPASFSFTLLWRTMVDLRAHKCYDIHEMEDIKMPVKSVSELRKTGLSQLDYTQYLLSGLKEDQLEAVQAVIIAFLKNDGAIDETGPAPFQPQTEAQLLARIDHSLAQIDTGEFAAAEDVENELLAGIDA